MWPNLWPCRCTTYQLHFALTAFLARKNRHISLFTKPELIVTHLVGLKKVRKSPDEVWYQLTTNTMTLMKSRSIDLSYRKSPKPPKHPISSRLKQPYYCFLPCTRREVTNGASSSTVVRREIIPPDSSLEWSKTSDAFLSSLRSCRHIPLQVSVLWTLVLRNSPSGFRMVRLTRNRQLLQWCIAWKTYIRYTIGIIQ